ncbi:MAG: insulinase family protein [Saprospirales bacterium]|nr:insulinase family protein [Saprospirales bacterium]MBK8920986.1 insulinase family protein [Saprospirales bacterium]
MKKIFCILAASALLSATTQTTVFAQNTKSGAPVIPIPSGAVRKAAPKEGSAPKIQIGQAETTKLANGLTVIVVENHKLPMVSFRIFVDYDPVRELDAAGYINMMGELLSKGTATRTKAKIDEEVDFIGASLSSDGNGVSGSCLTKHTDRLLELMADVLFNPAFPAEELEKAKRRAESNLASEKDDANAIAGNVGAVLRYGKDHPYGEVMTEATLAKINLDQIKSHYQTYFKPNIAYLVIVGDIKKADALARAEKYFGKWASGNVPAHKYGTPKQPDAAQVDFVHKPGAVQSVINITYPVELMQNNPDVIPARLMNTILGGSGYFNNRVNANLREGHGYTYGARTGLSPDEIIGFFNGSTSVRNAVTDSSIIEFMREMNRIRTEKVPAEELQLAKNVLTGQFSQSLERPGTIANFALSTARFKLPADYYEIYLANLQNVTADQILAMAQKYVRPDHAHILVVGNKDDVADRLKQFTASGKINFYDTYGNPIKDSNVSIPAGVTAQTIVSDYVTAIGGVKKIGTITDMKMAVTLVTPGPTLEMEIAQKGGNKLAVVMSMQGNVVQSRVYDGEKALESGMGGQRMLEGEELEDVREQAQFCKEAAYLSGGYKLTLKGVEPIDGKNAYVLEVERQDGKKSTEYYDMASSLKMREVSTTLGPEGEPSSVITDLGDYKEVNGILFPHSMTISGVFPVPMKGTVTELKVNAGLDDAVFQLK